MIYRMEKEGGPEWGNTSIKDWVEEEKLWKNLGRKGKRGRTVVGRRTTETVLEMQIMQQSMF